MVDQTLIDNITNRFQQGERAEQIKEALLNEGWSQGDIEAAFAHIRHNALLQIPLYAKLHNWLDHADQKTAQLSTGTMIKIFVGIALLFFLGVGALYYFLDPLGIQTSKRDQTREDNGVALREALANYNSAHHNYPSSLNALVPQYLSAVPVDPKTKKPYEYKVADTNANYQFCINFEQQPVRCISSDESSEIPSTDQLLQPTATPIPQINQYQVNGRVYIDDNNNKVEDPGEEPQGGVALKLLDSKLITICDMTSDTAGIFVCALPEKGTYTLQVSTPKGMVSVLGNPIQFTLPDPTSEQPTIKTLYVGLK